MDRTVPYAFSLWKEYSPEDDSILIREVHCLQLVAERTSVPVSTVFDHGTSNDLFGIPYILVNCLDGSCAIDMDRFVPPPFKATFYRQMARAHGQIRNLTFPQIGTIILQDEGIVDIGPIPGIGGPFDTATAYLRAWSDAAKFCGTEDSVRKGCGSLADDIWKSTVDFRKSLNQLADQICGGSLDHGPFRCFTPISGTRT